jgi:hypothetical protein
MGVPTVNIGARQRGRLRAPSVIDVDDGARAIVAGIERATSEEHRSLAARGESPYGGAGAAERTAEELVTQPLEGILEKRFHDLPQ